MTTILASLLTLLHPGCDAGHLEPVHYVNFALCHDSARKVPVWVAYSLDPARLQPAAEPRTRPRFRRDPNLALPAATDADYRNSFFTRGHMAPAADFAFSAEAHRSTFFLSNAAPQHPTLNLGRWSQLECAIRQLVIQTGSTLTVITGPIFDPAAGEPQFIGSNRVAVPTHFFKVILTTLDHHHTAYAFILPNTSETLAPLHTFATTIRNVEQQTGLDFFSFLPDKEENRLEGTHVPLFTGRLHTTGGNQEKQEAPR